MIKLKFAAILLAFGLIGTSCGDDDSTSPVVSITAPAGGTIYSITDTISVSATITDETELRSVNIMSDLGLDQTITTLDSETSHELNVNLTFDPETTAGSYSITVTGTDAEGNTGVQDVAFDVQ
ncbi:MAG: hypothetical protein ACI86M_001265 [Saprospiraceae bacterium]|jgi:hypothetical protein